MIASWRGLAVAAALAVGLAIVVGLDLERARGPEDRALLPDFDPDRVTELVWERPGQAAIHVARDARGWETRAPAPTDPASVAHVPADTGAVGDVLAALRGARWHRRGDPTPAHATLVIAAGGERHVIGIGEPIAGTEQTWLVDDGGGVVVDRWVARALDRDLLALRIKAPLAGIRRARTIVIEGELDRHVALHIDGQPRRLEAGAKIMIAADITGELERALGEFTIVRLPDAPGAAHGLAITTSDDDSPSRGRAVANVVLGGSCPGAPELVAVSGSAGDGCVERTTVAAIEHAIRRLSQPPEAIVERRPIPFEPRRVVLADATVLDIPTLRMGDHPAEPARVAELLAALAAPAEVTALPAQPATQHLVITGAGGATITLDLFADHVLSRHGEPIALRPASGAWSLLVRPARELRDATRWREEPTTITAVRIDDVGYQRGAIIGEWARQPAGAPGTRLADAKALEALVALLAAPRSLGFLDEQVATSHHVTLVVTPPTGAPTEHVLALGAPRAAGCPARVESEAILLPANVCAQVAALAK